MFVACRILVVTAFLLNLTAADAWSESVPVPRIAASTFQSPSPDSIILVVKKRRAKKAKRVSCPDLRAHAEQMCGRRMSCNGSSECLEALCSPRWKQCGYNPKCAC